MINTLPQSLIESAKKVLVESNSPRLHHIADVKTNFPDADYYVIRKGTPDTVGKITKEFSPEHIGVKINRTDVMDPRYHQYAMQYAHMNGYWKEKTKGALRLQHISVDDVKNMPALYQGLNESAEHPMIDVDGELKHRHNSNGIPIHHTDEGIRNFHRWFGDSKVIDEHGRPMVAYHGTKNDIEKFDKRKSRTNKAFFFSPSPEFASSPAYTGHIAPPSKGGGNVMPVYLRIKSPKYVSDLSMNPMVESGAIESARSGGNDGIYVERGNYWIAMEQKSIKSAIGNNGDFHPKNHK